MQLSAIHGQLRGMEWPPFFLVQRSDESVEIERVEKYDEFFANILPAPVSVSLTRTKAIFNLLQRTIGFIDPSALPHNPGWPLRNLLTYLRILYPTTSQSIRILCWRDAELPISDKPWRSRFGVLSIAAPTTENIPAQRPTAVGWEKNVQGKLGPRLADLGPMMDPKR
jgi:ubiquitin-like modifier-activating enzyme ATG7